MKDTTKEIKMRIFLEFDVKKRAKALFEL